MKRGAWLPRAPRSHAAASPTAGSSRFIDFAAWPDFAAYRRAVSENLRRDYRKAAAAAPILTWKGAAWKAAATCRRWSVSAGR